MKRSDVTRCRACGAAIFFVATDKNENMPVDLDPAPDGNLSITEGIPKPTAVVLTLGQASGMRAAGLLTYKSHFATCPYADEFRRKAKHNARIDGYRKSNARNR